MAIAENLKKAIVQMPQKEKDKLLLRLIAKDKILVQRLEFELIEHGDTVQIRRDEIKRRILQSAQMNYGTPGWLMMDMKNFSGDISQHVKITKDKYGEVELMLFLLKTFFDHQLDLLRVHNSKSDNCAEYIAKRTLMLLKNAGKLNEDYFVEFEQDINQLLQYVHTYCPRSYARTLEIAKSWP